MINRLMSILFGHKSAVETRSQAEILLDEQQAILDADKAFKDEQQRLLKKAAMIEDLANELDQWNFESHTISINASIAKVASQNAARASRVAAAKAGLNPVQAAAKPANKKTK
jgi:hypothetical protein